MPLDKQNPQAHQEVEIDAAEIHGIYDEHKFGWMASGLTANYLSAIGELNAAAASSAAPMAQATR
jgi:hypothetical protein